jgi:outer membrane receptor protein involved in Fe transport
LALSAEYQYENFERPDSGSFSLDAETHKVPLGVRVFDPSGWSFAVKTTYINQDGKFQRSGLCCESGSSEFWLTDASVSYRLPKRRGFITFGATNLFDRKFSYQETDFNNPSIVPQQQIFGRVSLALP